jgi:pyrimidine-nucleoside phosphorylase
LHRAKGLRYSGAVTNFLSLIETKRDGAALRPAEIEGIVREFTAGRLPDYQMSAFLMAVFFRGLNPEETRSLTLAMRDSGEALAFPEDPRPLVDKHSTGGVGDKVSLPLAPLLAELGFRVPMISGRGLGITGGTLDKLESIPGFTTNLPRERIVRQVQEIGCVICAQSENMVPADRLMYALRDVSGTVPSIPLITSSILSKKLSESLDALLLDVKFGCAAFMQTREEAMELARTMTRLAADCGVATHAILSPMDAPLGRTAGNWLEVRESADCLEGGGPGGLRQLVLECAGHLMRLGGRVDDMKEGFALAAACLDGGGPLRRWESMLVAQGADLAAYREKLRRDVAVPVVREVTSPQTGFVAGIDARVIGEVVRDLGGGRLTKGATVDPEVGIDRMPALSEAVQEGQTIARIHAASEAAASDAVERVGAAFRFSNSPGLIG